MHAQDEGWFELTVPGASAGTRYRFRTDSGLLVPDPASRYNPDDVHSASMVVDPGAFDWQDESWHGRPWEEAVIYELHVGTFTAQGDFDGVRRKLDYLAELGVTALELMPVADFPGRRNWGYDGVLPYAPDASYGSPEALKLLVQEAHARGLMVLLDVVYNHFGPEGNYLHAYVPDFFNERHHTPWGAAINFDAPGSAGVRDFFIHNALYWLEEYHLDGLRLDAIHAICDDSIPDIVEALADAVRLGPGKDRLVHLILENDRNQARYLTRAPDGAPLHATAQWNDDIHHAFHVLVTGETDGYYADYTTDPIGQLGRCLASGFAFQNDPSPFRDGELRGEPSSHLPPAAFVDFLQTHDQVGNRAFGERLCHLASPEALVAVTTVLLLAPQPPMLFMGEEFAAAQPFLFFCDFGPELAQAVTEGRRREFARFARFADPAARERIPDPNASATFDACVLDWNALASKPHSSMLALHRQLLALRREYLVPRLKNLPGNQAGYEVYTDNGLAVHWCLGDGSRWHLLCNMGEKTVEHMSCPAGETLYRSTHLSSGQLQSGVLPPWSVAWLLDASSARNAP
jgi:malto-oligosyltrehalose trehalohydrolase